MFNSNTPLRRTLSLSLLALLVATLLPLSASAQSVPTDGLQLWLRADAVEAADGAAVEAWSDRSPYARVLSQADRARQPTYVADAINGHPLLRFDENDRFDTSLLSAGAGYTVMRVTRQEDRGYVSVAEGTVGDDEAGSTLQRFLQGQVAEVLVYDRRLSETEKTTVSEALGQRYNLGPGTTTARSDDATGGTDEGVRVHGAWTITVRNPDGSLDERRTVENSFIGPQYLVDVMVHNSVTGPWEILAFHSNGNQNPCENEAEDRTRCISVEPSVTGDRPFAFKNLSVDSVDTDGSGEIDGIELSGSFVSARDGIVDVINSGSRNCNDQSTTINECLSSSINDTASPFTSKQLSSDINVTQQQQVAVSVVISFE